MLPKNRRPTHPGEILKYEYLEPLGMTEQQLAELLGISQGFVNALIQEKSSVTPDIAFRLARLFNTSADFWLNLQRHTDMWDALQIYGHEYEKICPLSVAVKRGASGG
jgi:addiction module HigA family antidote